MTITKYKTYTFKTIQPLLTNTYTTFIFNKNNQLVFTTNPYHINNQIIPRRWVDLQK